MFKIELTNTMDADILFHLVPLSNLLLTDDEKRYVAKDAYYRLYHVETETWISYKEELVRGEVAELLKLPAMSIKAEGD